MNHVYDDIVDRLLDMQPDPIPYFVLLKEFIGCSPDSVEYQNAYERVCEHPFVKEIETSQNGKGFWPSFHSYTEGLIRKLLWYGLDTSHICLKRVRDYTEKLLLNEEPHDRFERQDNVRWWLEIFMPLVCAATLSLINNTNVNLDFYRKRWADFAGISLIKSGYDGEADKKAQNDYFGFSTKRIIPPHNYYNFLLLPPRNGISYLDDNTDQALIDFCVNQADGIYYVYNNKLGEMVSINAQNKDSRDFCHWIRVLSLVAQFKGWAKYEQKYVDWIMTQRNQDGLWEFPKKFEPAILSDSWKGKNKAIDSTIFVLRLLLRKTAF